MSANLSVVLKSSVFRKQVSALTGLALVGFVVAHLAGNLLIFAGPEAFNDYAHQLQSLGHGKVVWVMRFGLIGAFVIHMGLTIMLAIENSKARATRYEMTKSHGNRKFATRAMKYTGIMIALFIILHLYDFTFGDKTGTASIVEGLNDGESLGLFGLVWNSFQQWWRVILYILAVSSVGLHLTHAIQSVFQTLGFNHDRYTPLIQKLSLAVGILLALVFSSIPLYVALASKPFGV